MPKAKKKNYQKLIRLEKHPNFWKNPESGVIYWRGYIKKRAYKVSCKTTKITEAKKFAENFKMKLTSSNLSRDKRKAQGVKNPTFKELWDECVGRRKATSAKSTIKGYQSSLKKMLPFWGNKNLSDITAKTVTDFEAWFLKTYPNHVFFNTGKHLQMVINYLVREGYLQKKIDVRKIDAVFEKSAKRKKAFRIYTDAQKNRLIEKAVSERARVCLILYFDTGLRKMELLSRKRKDFSFEKKTLNIWSSKNKKWREIPLTKRACDSLKAWVDSLSDGTDYLFPMANKKSHISSQVFDKQWTETKKKARLSGKARVHDIRHTFATKTAKDGWPMPIACEFLDMSPSIYMKTYVHITRDDMFKWVKKSFS